MKRVITFFYLAFWVLLYSCGCFAVDHKDTYIKGSEVTCSDSDNSESCYKELICQLKDKMNSEELSECLNVKSKYTYSEMSYKDFSLYSLYEEKPSTILVAIHGLWGNSMQFYKAMNRDDEAHFNKILLTLPGHKKFKYSEGNYIDAIAEDPPYVHYQEWLLALKETLILANKLADEVVIIGQSTGGLLATIAGIEYPELVDQMVLVEPALQVNGFKNFGACISDKYIPQSVISNLGSLIGIDTPDGVSIKMGCEVQKLADEYFKRRHHYVKRSGAASGFKYLEDYTVYSEVASEINIPVLMFNNVYDEVVSSKANMTFFKGLNVEKSYIAFNQDKKLQHGEVTNSGANNLAYEISKFKYLTNPTDPLRNIYLYQFRDKLRQYQATACFNYEKLSECENRFSDLIKNRDVFFKEACLILKDKQKCHEFKTIIKGFNRLFLYFLNIGLNDGYDEYRRHVRESNTLYPQMYEEFNQMMK